MKTHPLNVTYLVLGLVFLGISGSWALAAANVVDFGGFRWLLPLTLVVAGVVGLVAFAAKGLTGGSRKTEETTYDDYSTDYLDNEGEPR